MLGIDCAIADHAEGSDAAAGIVDCPLEVPAVAGVPDPRNAAAILDSLRRAAGMAADGGAQALVTGPLAKHVIAAARPDFRGHTGYLGDLAGCETVMAFVGPDLRVALVTEHLPLAQVPAAISCDRVLRTLEIADAGMRGVLGGTRPRWLVCGLNPHAGEDGLLGSEDGEHIAPAIEEARERGIDAAGPIPADTAFLPERHDGRSCVLAMYHDQALPAVKRDAFSATVNVTFGLPYVRTSVDHGTAFELAGSGSADAAPLRAAVELAAGLARPQRLT